MSWFTPSNNIVSDLYAVYNEYNITSRYQSAFCMLNIVDNVLWSFSRQKLHVVGIAELCL